LARAIRAAYELVAFLENLELERRDELVAFLES
jgi:hypothetical protein